VFQVGQEDYSEKAFDQCRKYKKLIKEKFVAQFGRDPLCELKIGGEEHEFGTYYEVKAVFENDEEAEDAFWIENNLPENWS
jgi:hypothetical protein